MSVGMDKTTKTINQPLARKISKTTLGKVVGKVGILSKPPACKQTHTLPAQGNRNPRWAFHTGHPGEDYIGDLPGHVHSTAFEHKQNTKTLSLLMVHPAESVRVLLDITNRNYGVRVEESAALNEEEIMFWLILTNSIYLSRG